MSKPLPLSQSTRNIQLRGSTLSAECPRTMWVASEINLDSCLGNIDGSFQWDEAGFSLSARRVTLKGTILSALLRTQDGRWVHSEIDLSERIANVGGQLEELSEEVEPPAVVPPVTEPGMCMALILVLCSTLIWNFSSWRAPVAWTFRDSATWRVSHESFLWKFFHAPGKHHEVHWHFLRASGRICRQGHSDLQYRH
jgi:hypothetical protein